MHIFHSLKSVISAAFFSFFLIFALLNMMEMHLLGSDDSLTSVTSGRNHKLGNQNSMHIPLKVCSDQTQSEIFTQHDYIQSQCKSTQIRNERRKYAYARVENVKLGQKICVPLWNLSALRFSWRHRDSEMEDKLIVTVWGQREQHDSMSLALRGGTKTGEGLEKSEREGVKFTELCAPPDDVLNFQDRYKAAIEVLSVVVDGGNKHC